MNYKDTLFFISKSLTVSHEKENRDKVEFVLKKGGLDWDRIVKVSTGHYILPALYFNFKKVNFLKYLPPELVKYMKYITELNIERNNKIIEEAIEINNILSKNDITPIFLRGTGNVLEGLYSDPGERMIGDIDFLVEKNDLNKAVAVLKDNDYFKLDEKLEFFSEFRHYPRLVKSNKIAAIEVHSEVILENYRKEFSSTMLSKNTIKKNDLNFLSFENQLCLSVFSSQINDYGFKFKNLPLRNAYDVYLLSKKVNTKEIINKFNKLKNPINSFLATCNLAFGDIESLGFFESKETTTYLIKFTKSISNQSFTLKNNLFLFLINLKRWISILFRSIFDKKNRVWLIRRIIRRIKI